MRRLPRCRRLFATVSEVIGAAALLVGCSASSGPSASFGPTQAEVIDRAQAQIADPGVAEAVVASSLPGVAQWTLYFGSGITFAGTNDSGALVGALALELDSAKNVHAVVSAVSSGFDVEPEVITKAIATDFAGVSDNAATHVTTSSLHPLAEPASDNPCKKCFNNAAALLDDVYRTTKLATRRDASLILYPNNSATVLMNLWAQLVTDPAVLKDLPRPQDVVGPRVNWAIASCCESNASICRVGEPQEPNQHASGTELIAWPGVRLVCAQ
jgi:hypothetical protein